MRGPVPPIQIYIHVLLHRLGVIAGNHFNGPYRVTEGVWYLGESQIPMLSLETLCESSRVDRLLVCGGGAWVSCNHSPNSLFLSLRPILKDLTTIGVKFYIHI